MHTPFTKIAPKIATVAFASLVLAAGTAAAQEMRKDQVQDRVHDTNQRINQEYREGNISRGQAHELTQENRGSPTRRGTTNTPAAPCPTASSATSTSRKTP